jgi:AraC-like DNA-binding protein
MISGLSYGLLQQLRKIVFSTDDLPPGLSEEARVKLWRDTLAYSTGTGDCTALPDMPFSARWEFARFGEVILARSSGTVRTLIRTQQQALAAGFDHYDFSFVTSDTPVVRTQRGHQRTYRKGDIAFEISQEAVAIGANAPSTWLGVMVPRRQLNELTRHADRLTSRPLDPNSPVARHLRNYIGMLLNEEGLEDDSALANHVGKAVVDLVALAVGVDGDAAALAQARGLRAARVKAVLTEIQNNFSQPEFSTDSLARRLGLSARYIQDLLQETGMGLSDRVLELRLQLARSMLTDPNNDGRRITDIALACGFNEVSHFNRCFRRRFGCSPTQYRGR